MNQKLLRRSLLSLLSLDYPADKKEILLVVDSDVGTCATAEHEGFLRKLSQTNG
jgi:cellulose synthase/poly-beta-1,6-N-acetylglucosamine synthase-like glycosyltransferase